MFFRRAFPKVSTAYWVYNLMTFLGMVKVAHQKLEMLAIVVLIRSSLPTNERDFDVQLLTFLLNCLIKGSQLTIDSFSVQRGTPK